MSNKETFANTAATEQMLDRAVELHQAGQLQEAERLYRTILATSPDHPMALHFLGLMALQLGNLVVAVDLMEKAIALQPDYVAARCNLAHALLQLDRAADAETHCRAAIRMEPDHASAHNHLAKALRLQGRFEDAAQSCREALALNPGLAEAHETLGGALGEMGRLDDAIAAYRQAIDAFPDAALFHNNLGSALSMLGQHAAAVDAYEKAIALEADYILAYQNLATALRGMGRIDETIAWLKKAIAIAPEMSSLRHNLDALQGHTPDNAPRDYVEQLFDPYAGRFEGDLVEKLGYTMPSLLKQALVDLELAHEPFSTVVDLGCGTGLAGVAFKDLATTLIGIDLSKNMVREAEAKGVYDRLIVDDLAGGLESIHDPVGLFVCADVFIYVGSLDETFEAVRKHAAPGAVFAFSTEHSESTDTFTLQTTSRYAHAKAYIENLATEHGFHLLHFAQHNLRKEKDGWIPGGLYVLRLG